ncbi:MAG: hypothetical protein HY587_07935 [Candidatus Omnitrophica bacterium]|nr:hypothetical protein [Candidatus Omnitrophota bacterium]
MRQLRTCIYILFALSFVALLLTVLVFSKRENEKAKRLEVEAQVKELLGEKDRLTQAYDSAKTAKGEAETKLDQEIRRARELEQELVIEKREKDQLAGQVATLSRDLETLNTDYEAVQSKYEDVARTVKQLKDKFEQLKRQRASEPVELPPVVVKPEKDLKGEVLVVNDVFKFVVINLGQNDGLAEGMFLDVVRGSEKVARLQVDRLYDSLAACAVLRQNVETPIEMHDLVHTV